MREVSRGWAGLGLMYSTDESAVGIDDQWLALLVG